MIHSPSLNHHTQLLAMITTMDPQCPKVPILEWMLRSIPVPHPGILSGLLVLQAWVVGIESFLPLQSHPVPAGFLGLFCRPIDPHHVASWRRVGAGLCFAPVDRSGAAQSLDFPGPVGGCVADYPDGRVGGGRVGTLGLSGRRCGGGQTMNEVSVFAHGLENQARVG